MNKPHRLYVLMDNYFDRRDDVHFRVNGVQDIKGFVDSESFYYLVFGSESPVGINNSEVGGDLLRFDNSCEILKELE